MHCEIRDASATAESLTEGIQCLWVRLAPRSEPSPLGNRLLQWVDWKMQGALSRFLLEEKYKGGGITFFATLKRLGVPFIVVDCSRSTDPAAVAKSCDGLKLDSVLVVEEDGSQAQELKKLFTKTKAELPKNVWIATEARAGARGS